MSSSSCAPGPLGERARPGERRGRLRRGVVRDAYPAQLVPRGGVTVRGDGHCARRGGRDVIGHAAEDRPPTGPRWPAPRTIASAPSSSASRCSARGADRSASARKSTGRPLSSPAAWVEDLLCASARMLERVRVAEPHGRGRPWVRGRDRQAPSPASWSARARASELPGPPSMPTRTFMGFPSVAPMPRFDLTVPAGEQRHRRIAQPRSVVLRRAGYGSARERRRRDHHRARRRPRRRPRAACELLLDAEDGMEVVAEAGDVDDRAALRPRPQARRARARPQHAGRAEPAGDPAVPRGLAGHAASSC